MAPESRFHSHLKAKVLALIAQREIEISTGIAPDYPAYKFLVGNLIGLKEALSLCEETEREFDV